MQKQWIGCHTTNFHTGRGGFRPEAVVLHRSGGTLAMVDARCARAATYNSAHYGIGSNGEVHQYVKEQDSAFHAGIVVNPTWKLFKAARNPNLYTVGVELAGSTGEAVTNAQYESAAGLIAEIAARWNLATDAEHVVLHDEIRAGAGCPGNGFDRAGLLAMAGAQRIASAPLANGHRVSGISSLDNLLNQPPGPMISAGTEPAAVGAIQDLLTGLGSAGMPSLLSANYGTWTARTLAAVQAFQNACGLPVKDGVDRMALEKMIEQPAADARATQAYLTLVLEYSFTGIHKILSLVAQMEGAGKFAAFNRNTDRAGASFGVIQWAQKPGRLAEILSAMSEADREKFVATFGAGDSAIADGLLTNCHKPSGGVDPKSGVSVSAIYDLVREPWIERFQEAAAFVPFQKTQISLAIEAFRRSAALIRQYAPDLVSERAVGFMLDVANQFGDGGARALYTRVHKSGMGESDVLEAVADATVAAMDDSQKAGVRSRRDRFLETPFLSSRVTFGL